MNTRRYITSLLLLTLTVALWAQGFNKSSYYKSADGLKGKDLKTALAGIIYTHTTISYDGLWNAYKTTDKRDDGCVWDMYSSTTNFNHDSDRVGSYKKEGDVYNREHSLPQSWFNDASPMKSDLYHVYPTDGYVNNRRSNYCFGYVGDVTYASNNSFSKVGHPTTALRNAGCNESYVFEPNDLYKGDFARSYFYMVTAYENQVSSWSSGMLSGNKYPAFTSWAKSMLLEWSENDQVSEKETDRIEAVYNLQKNRNPFIDFPGLEEYIWGEWQTVAFSVDEYINPYTGTKPDGGKDPIDPTPDDTTHTDTTIVIPQPHDSIPAGELVYYESFDNCSSTGGRDDRWTGGIASGAIAADLSGWEFTSGYGASECVRLGTGSKRGTAVTPAFDHVGDFILTFEAAAWGTDSNVLNLSVNSGTLSQDTVVITNQAFKTCRVLITGATAATRVTIEGEHSSNNRFFLDEVRLSAYVPDGIAAPEMSAPVSTRIYDLSGRSVSSIRRPGIYIIGGRKVVRR